MGCLNMTQHAAICQDNAFWDTASWITSDGTVISNATTRDAYYYCRYTTVTAYESARARSLSEPEVCEILGPWTTAHGPISGSTLWGTSEEIDLTYITVGVARHSGAYPTGTQFRVEGTTTAWAINSLNTQLDGIAGYVSVSTADVFSVMNTKINCGFVSCIAKGGRDGFSFGSISAGYGGRYVINCIAQNTYRAGFYFDGATYYKSIMVNCLAYNCNTSSTTYFGGFAAKIGSLGAYSYLINCISIGNGYADYYRASFSANIQFENCISGDSTASGTSCYTGKTANEIFTNAASGNFSLLVSSFARDLGAYISNLTPDRDIISVSRNPASVDIGPFEYDTGYTPPAAATSLTISAQVSLAGAEVRIYDLNASDGTFGTELAGTESNVSATYAYTGLRTNVVAIQIMQSGYEEFLQTITLENVTQSLPITLKADINA